MIVLPLFWDQYDNAQRVDELGYGVRLDTYGHEPDELRGAVERLLGDKAGSQTESVRARMRPIAERLQASPGTIRAAGLIEELVT